jgi:hypothetical protein
LEWLTAHKANSGHRHDRATHGGTNARWKHFLIVRSNLFLQWLRSVRRAAFFAIAKPLVGALRVVVWSARTWVLIPAFGLRALLRVRRLEAVSRQAAYDLLASHGDLQGAIVAFDRLTEVQSRPGRSVGQQDELMRRVLPGVAEIEGGLARDLQGAVATPLEGVWPVAGWSPYRSRRRRRHRARFRTGRRRLGDTGRRSRREFLARRWQRAMSGPRKSHWTSSCASGAAHDARSAAKMFGQCLQQRRGSVRYWTDPGWASDCAGQWPSTICGVVHAELQKLHQIYKVNV